MKKLSTILITLVMIFALSTMFIACSEKLEESTTTSPSTTTTTPEEDVVEIIDGYIWVNGVNTGIKAEQCEHVWQTVTTAPTCTAGGYDTVTCKICDKTYTDNETEKLEHTYSTTYTIDDDYHWFYCTGCGEIKDKEFHTVNNDGDCTVCQMPVVATPGIIYDISDDGTYAIVLAYEGTATKVKIASEYKGLPVQEIYASAFYGNDNITDVVIPNSVITIGNSAFSRCDKLTSIVIPDSVTSIGGSTFWACYNLQSVIIGNGVKSIPDYTFSSCHNLQSVIIGNGVTSINNSAFSDSPSLLFTEYEYGKYIGNSDNPYMVLIELTTKNLSTYEIHKDTKIIADGLFRDCSRLSSITIPDSVTSIGITAFYGCTSLTSIVIPDSVTSIGYQAFSGCTSLASIVIPDSVTSIGSYAFSNCTSLTSVEIPDSVTSIGDCAFNGCSSLTDVYYTGTQEEWNKIQIGSYNYLTRATIHYNYIPE